MTQNQLFYKMIMRWHLDFKILLRGLGFSSVVDALGLVLSSRGRKRPTKSLMVIGITEALSGEIAPELGEMVRGSGVGVPRTHIKPGMAACV